MKVFCINGSPHEKGNTATMMRVFSETSDELGATVKTRHLNRLNYKGCQGCMACKGKSDICILKDDLTDTLAEAADADVLVLGSPVYFGDVTSQLKGFIDRTFSYLNPGFMTGNNPSRLKPGKTLVMILPQGAPDEESFNDIFKKYSGFFKYFGYTHEYSLRGCGLGDPEDADKNTKILEKVRKTAREIVVS